MLQKLRTQGPSTGGTIWGDSPKSCHVASSCQHALISVDTVTQRLFTQASSLGCLTILLHRQTIDSWRGFVAVVGVWLPLLLRGGAQQGLPVWGALPQRGRVPAPPLHPPAALPAAETHEEHLTRARQARLETSHQLLPGETNVFLWRELGGEVSEGWSSCGFRDRKPHPPLALAAILVQQGSSVIGPNGRASLWTSTIAAGDVLKILASSFQGSSEDKVGKVESKSEISSNGVGVGVG